MLVYGFVTDILFINDKGYDICIDSISSNGEPFNPIYASVIIRETEFSKILDKYNQYVNKQKTNIDDIEIWVQELNSKYKKKYKCKWMLAFFADFKYHKFTLEEDMLSEVEDIVNNQYDELSDEYDHDNEYENMNRLKNK